MFYFQTINILAKSTASSAEHTSEVTVSSAEITVTFGLNCSPHCKRHVFIYSSSIVITVQGFFILRYYNFWFIRLKCLTFKPYKPEITIPLISFLDIISRTGLDVDLSWTGNRRARSCSYIQSAA